MKFFVGNLLFIAASLIFLAGSTPGQVKNERLRLELLDMVKRDQAARDECAKGNADEQIKCIVRTAQEIDAPNTKRIEEILNTTGFPTSKAVGIDGVKAYFLILQHSDSIVLRLRCRKGIGQAWREKVLSPSEYTGFIDRLLVKQGKPQIYGSNFESKDGKLIMSKTKDPKNLDKRRKHAGLPTIAEYVEMLKKAYNLEVVLTVVK
ncbi:MAG: DUF6624 domain-containing protein [Pyrinomonadaceae bacterium]